MKTKIIFLFLILILSFLFFNFNIQKIDALTCNYEECEQTLDLGDCGYCHSFETCKEGACYYCEDKTETCSSGGDWCSGSKECSRYYYDQPSCGDSGCEYDSYYEQDNNCNSLCGSDETCEDGSCVKECDDHCDEGDVLCQKSTLYECEKGSDGCWDWKDEPKKNCADESECEETGEKYCKDGKDGDVWEKYEFVWYTCDDGDTDASCKKGGVIEDEECESKKVEQCTEREICENGSCVLACTDECDPSNYPQCDGDTVQECEKQSDDCYDIVDGTNCNDYDDCETDGDVEKYCKDGKDGDVWGKYDYKDYYCSGGSCDYTYDYNSCGDEKLEDCGANEICENGSCVLACTDECDPSNYPQCDGDTVQECEKQSDDCYDIVDGTNCNDYDDCETDGDVEKYCKNGDVWGKYDYKDYYCSGGSCDYTYDYNSCGDKRLTNCQGNGCEEDENGNATCKPEAKMDCSKSKCGGGNCSETYQASSDEKPCLYTLVNNSTDPDGNDDIKETRWYIREKDDSSGYWGINGSYDSGCQHGSYNQEEHYSDEDDGDCKWWGFCTDKEEVYVGENSCNNDGSGSCYKLKNPVTVYENCKEGDSCWVIQPLVRGRKESVSNELTGYNETKECQWITDSNYSLLRSCSGRDCEYTLQNRTPGEYVIKLEVEDEFGAKDSTTQSLTILKETQADFKCSLSPDGNWKDCDKVDVSTEETLFFKDTSTLSENATQFTSWEWQQDGSTFSDKRIASTTIESTDDKIKLIIEDNKNRKDSEEKTIDATLPLPEWEETGL